MKRLLAVLLTLCTLLSTLISCGYTDGSLGYMPSDEAFPHGEYEVYACNFVSGTGEICAQKLTEMLNYAN